MLPEQNETNTAPKDSPDLFAEPRDHANQWDISVLWEEEKRQWIEPNAGREAE